MAQQHHHDPRHLQQRVLALLALTLLLLVVPRASAFLSPSTRPPRLSPFQFPTSGRRLLPTSPPVSSSSPRSLSRLFSSETSEPAAEAKENKAEERSADEELMDDLIACPWDELEEFGNKVSLVGGCWVVWVMVLWGGVYVRDDKMVSMGLT